VEVSTAATLHDTETIFTKADAMEYSWQCIIKAAKSLGENEDEDGYADGCANGDGEGGYL
jgi:hypothetical protein